MAQMPRMPVRMQVRVEQAGTSSDDDSGSDSDGSDSKGYTRMLPNPNTVTLESFSKRSGTMSLEELETVR